MVQLNSVLKALLSRLTSQQLEDVLHSFGGNIIDRYLTKKNKARKYSMIAFGVSFDDTLFVMWCDAELGHAEARIMASTDKPIKEMYVFRATVIDENIVCVPGNSRPCTMCMNRMLGVETVTFAVRIDDSSDELHSMEYKDAMESSCFSSRDKRHMLGLKRGNHCEVS